MAMQLNSMKVSPTLTPSDLTYVEYVFPAAKTVPKRNNRTKRKPKTSPSKYAFPMETPAVLTTPKWWWTMGSRKESKRMATLSGGILMLLGTYVKEENNKTL